MKSRLLAAPIAVLLGIACGPIAHAALTTNDWSNTASGTWNWATASNWQLGAPSINQSACMITNEAGLIGGIHTRTVTIDSTTVSQPGTLTVTNVFISAPGTGIKASHNTLFLDNAGLTTPLHVLHSLIISNNGSVIITNSELISDATSTPSYELYGTTIYGDLQLQSGLLLTVNTNSIYVTPFSIDNDGQMTVLGGTWQGQEADIGNGTLFLDGGSVNLSYFLNIGGPTGSVFMTGGQANLGWIGVSGGANSVGQMTMSGGMCVTPSLVVGDEEDNEDSTDGPVGTLTLAGGTMTVSGANSFDDFSIGGSDYSRATVWLTGSQLITTNASTLFGYGSGDEFFPAQSDMIVSNGVWLARDVTLGFGFYQLSTLKMVGGTVTISSNLVVGGSCDYGVLGEVSVYQGTLSVTNASHTAVLEVNAGTLTINASGTVNADVIVVTNSCGVVYTAGGILNYGTAILDPNGDADLDGLPNWWEQAHGLNPFDPFFDNGPYGDPDGDGYNNYEEYLAGSDPQDPLSTPVHPNAPPFQITSIVQSGNNIIITWNTAGGLTNQVQVTSGGAGGIFSTNGFTNLGSQLIIPGSGITTTNYTDTGGATNVPARYYRVRLVP